MKNKLLTGWRIVISIAVVVALLGGFGVFKLFQAYGDPVYQSTNWGTNGIPVVNADTTVGTDSDLTFVS